MTDYGLLDSSPMIVHRPDEGWCCLLCLRKFPSEAHVQKHLAKSSLHANNLVAATAAGRTGGAHKLPKPSAASKRPREEEREVPPPSSVSGSSLSNKLSAIEQMELFEKRLKVEKQRQPEKPSASHEAEVDSNRARTINQQRDWECSGCGMINFARVVVCGKCRRHVDSSTKYLTNRLKEIKHERFARFSAAEGFGSGPPPPEQRADGSHPMGAARASFSQH